MSNIINEQDYELSIWWEGLGRVWQRELLWAFFNRSNDSTPEAVRASIDEYIGFDNIDPTLISSLLNMRWLDIGHWENDPPDSIDEISDLSPLIRFTALEYFYTRSTQLKSLEPLRHISTLNTIEIVDSPITSLSPLWDLNLDSLTVHSTLITEEEYKKYIADHPSTTVNWVSNNVNVSIEMTEREELLESIATTTADYREGDLLAPTPDHINRWVKQFNSDVQLPILREMDHVLKTTYFSLEKVTRFLKSLLVIEKLVGSNHAKFWKSVRFLNIQGGGNSQREMLAIFGKLLEESCGVEINHCGESPESFIYLDDAIFTGNRVLRDLQTWIQSEAPIKSKIHIICIALHSGGQYYANGRLQSAAKAVGKSIEITWWRAIELEDRRAYTNSSDVLRPAMIPDVVDVKQYVEAMQFKPNLRTPGNLGSNRLFSSDEGRNLLEQEFLKAGVKIRQMCPNLGVTQRPLGHITLETFGFGSLIVTFRNCPNNAPLAFWVGDPWYALFPRTTNSQTSINRLMAMFVEEGFGGI